MGKEKVKFKFGIDFQELILKYTLTDKKGYKIIPLYDDSYFEIIEHAVVANAIKKYFKKKQKVPEKALLKETLRHGYESNHKLYNKLTPDERKGINELVENLYEGTVADSDSVVDSIKTFARYIKFRSELESIDVLDYDSYEASANKLKAALSLGEEASQTMGVFLVGGMKDRAHKRDQEHFINPTPIWQLNRVLNSGGLTKASLVMFASQAKRFKTGSLINMAKYYLKRRKKLLYVDLENGEMALTVRTEQSILKIKQEEIMSGDKDDQLLKLFRRYKRIGAELNIIRMPAFTTTCLDIQSHIDKVYLETGVKFDAGIIDFGDLLGANSGVKDEFNRISEAYVDMKNLASYNDWDWIATASHVKASPETLKRKGTVYLQNDLAKCVDKIRHCDLAIGVQESDEETEAGVMRWEVMEVRNGKKGKMLFWVDIEKQSLVEFTKAEVQEYMSQIGEETDEEVEHRKNKQKEIKRERKSDI